MTNDLLEAIRLWLWHITIAGFEIQAYLTNVSSLWITVWFLILRRWTDSVTNVKAITSILHTSSPWLAAAYFSCFSNICSNNGIFFQEWIPWICWRVLKPRGHSAASSLKTVYPQIRKSQGQRWRVTDEVYPPQIMGQFTAYAFVLIGGAILILLGPDHQNSALGQSIYILIAASARFLAYLTAARKQSNYIDFCLAIRLSLAADNANPELLFSTHSQNVLQISKLLHWSTWLFWLFLVPKNPRSESVHYLLKSFLSPSPSGFQVDSRISW